MSKPIGAAARQPRLGFLGVGWIGRNRLEAIARSEVAEVAAIVDSSQQLAREAAKSCGNAPVLGSFNDLLARELALDGIVIATPSAFHAEQSMAALNRGIAVFCQKPLARTADETHAVIDAARANNCLLGVDFSYRHLAGMQKIRELLQQQALGKIFAVELAFHNAYGPDKPWFFDRRLSGGGCVIDLGVHLVDLVLWALDYPVVEHVSSRLLTRGGENAVEDYAVARMDLAGGISVQLACSWCLPAGCDAIISAAFYGTKGGALLRNVNGSFYDFQAERGLGTKRELLARPPEDWGGRAAIDWACQLAAGRKFDRTCERLLDVARAVDQIYAGQK